MVCLPIYAPLLGNVDQSPVEKPSRGLLSVAEFIRQFQHPPTLRSASGTTRLEEVSPISFLATTFSLLSLRCYASRMHRGLRRRSNLSTTLPQKAPQQQMAHQQHRQEHQMYRSSQTPEGRSCLHCGIMICRILHSRIAVVACRVVCFVFIFCFFSVLFLGVLPSYQLFPCRVSLYGTESAPALHARKITIVPQPSRWSAGYHQDETHLSCWPAFRRDGGLNARRKRGI